MGTRTSIQENKYGLPDLSLFIKNVYTYAVDWPVTSFHDFIECQRGKRKIYYYHWVFQCVPDLSQCLEDDLFCQYKAEMQWRRDLKVDGKILKIMRERYTACVSREGYSSSQNCAELKEQLAQAGRGYKSRYEYLGANGNARKCLIKQKERMIEEKEAAKADQA